MTSHHTDPSNPPSRRGMLGILAAAPLVATVPPLDVASGRFVFYAILWTDHGGLVGVGCTEEEAWRLAEDEILYTSRMSAEDDPDSWPDPEGTAAETFADCRKGGICLRIEAAAEAAGYAAAGIFTDWRSRNVLRIWRAAFPAPVDGPDPFAAAVEAEEEEERRRDAERAAEEAVREAKWRAEEDARRAAAPPPSPRGRAIGGMLRDVFRATEDDGLDDAAIEAMAARVRAAVGAA